MGWNRGHVLCAVGTLILATFFTYRAFAAEPYSAAPGTSPDKEAVYPKGYDGFQASRDAQAYWDSRRVDAINRQLGWNEMLRLRAATTQPSTLYYSPYVPTRWDDPWGDLGYGWPYGVGRIYGYGFYDAVRQPIGRREVQTGPNRWESFPVYAEDLLPDASPVPPVVQAPDAVSPKIDLPLRPAPPVVPDEPKGREF